jgi:hypothetical protein
MKRSLISKAVALALVLPGVSMAEIDWEISGFIKNETALYTSKGTTIGDLTAHETDVYKNEISLKLFVNAEMEGIGSLHAEISPIYDTSAELYAAEGAVANAADENYQEPQMYTQQDPLRELYLDMNIGDSVSMRLGKQQVVWGTADGIKLLDIINPTDWREFAQNTMEDSRIPVWMLNTEIDVGESGNLQLIVAQAEKNKIPGLNAGGDQGHPFIMKGVDTITGKQNGFLNIAPNMGNTASKFVGFTAMFNGFNADGTRAAAPFNADGSPANAPLGLAAVGGGGFTVGQFIQGQSPFCIGMRDPATGAPTGEFVTPVVGMMPDGVTVMRAGDDGTGTQTCAQMLFNIATNPSADGSVAGNTDNTRLTDASYDSDLGDTAFELMPNATFATFDAFAGISSSYEVAEPKEEINYGFRYKFGIGDSTNVSLNYFYGNDANPHINLSWRGANGNALTATEINLPTTPAEQLAAVKVQLGTAGLAGVKAGMDAAAPGSFDALRLALAGGDAAAAAGIDDDTVSASSFMQTFMADTQTGLAAMYPVLNATGMFTSDVGAMGADGVFAATGANGTADFFEQSAAQRSGIILMDGAAQYDSTAAGGAATLVFTEAVNSVTNVGGAFDTTIETPLAPVVLRGELLYRQGEMKPVVNRTLLAKGDLVGALQSVESDVVKYVVGVDITVLTNMMISTQLIQFKNMDYVDTGSSLSDAEWKYTGDMSTMHLSNQLQKGDETEQFVSIFFSKPFGAEQQHRWNNIMMFENDGGTWNRFDVEYAVSDEFLTTFEINSYAGEEETQFGQMVDSSNVQLGLKYQFSL